jgi:predicted N-acetyltransferase YhbS
MNNITIREARASDAPECGRICYQAFAAIASAHNFTPDFPNEELASGLIGMMLGHRGFHGIVAEVDGRVVGSNFLDERGAVWGLGPITVDPSVQNQGVGERLMRAALARAEHKQPAGVRLVQAGYHCRSLALYSKLGFEVREHLSCVQGSPIRGEMRGYGVRTAVERDLPACNALAVRIYGHHRAAELQDATAHGTATVVERGGRITGYATQIAFFGHATGETTDDVRALITAAESYAGPGFLVPSRNGELLRWCLQNGLRIRQPLTLMTLGLYNEPAGAYLPSILY